MAYSKAAKRRNVDVTEGSLNCPGLRVLIVLHIIRIMKQMGKILHAATSLIQNIQSAQRRGRSLLVFLWARRAAFIDPCVTANENKDADHVTYRGAVAMVTPGLVELQVMHWNKWKKNDYACEQTVQLFLVECGIIKLYDNKCVILQKVFSLNLNERLWNCSNPASCWTCTLLITALGLNRHWK